MRPTARTLWLFAIGLPVAAAPSVLATRLWPFWLMFIALMLLAIGIDFLLCVPRRHIAVEVAVPDQIAIGVPSKATLTLSAPRATTVDVLVELSGRLRPQPEARATLAAAGPTPVTIKLEALRRGNAVLERIWLRWYGPFGLMCARATREVDKQVAVVPNIAPVRGIALRYFTPREAASGLKIERYVGDGTEFDALREYVPGFDARSLNWRATARHRKLICNEFRAERNHQVVLAFDTGHLMSEPIEGIPKLDHAVTAGLVTAYACLRTGDRVGMFAFDEEVRTYSEPQGGVHNFQRIQRLTSDLAYRSAETNFTLGLAELSTRLRRRSLVVLLTDFVDTVTTELMLDNIALLSKRHLVLFVAIRDVGPQRLRAQAPNTMSTLYESVVATEFVRERELVLKRLKRMGVHCLDAPPAQLGPQLLKRYLDIKRRELV